MSRIKRKTRTATLAVTLAAMALAASGAASADDSWRCGAALVNVGDSILAVEDDCGPPDRRVRLINDVGGQVGTAYYYQGGYGVADRKVIFRGGRVAHIARLD